VSLTDKAREVFVVVAPGPANVATFSQFVSTNRR
jgi:hypothetical protein